MLRLAECPDCAVESSRRTFTATLAEPKTGQRLTLHSPAPFVLRQIDLGDAAAATHWPATEKRPDGVLLVKAEHSSYVIFLELKGAIELDEDDFPRRAYDQCLAGVRHFGPHEAHGAEHHAAWRDGEDRPEVSIARDHVVMGVVVVQRGGKRGRSTTVRAGDVDVNLVVFQRSGPRHHVDMPLSEFLMAIGLVGV